MPNRARSHIPNTAPLAAASMTPAETARYTCELLESLRKIAARQNQAMLAHLLELARYEAQSLTVSPPSATAPTPKTPDSPDAGHSALPVPARAER